MLHVKCHPFVGVMEKWLLYYEVSPVNISRILEGLPSNANCPG